MNKKHFIPSVASITICSLALCNCSTISKYRKEPSEWNTQTAPVAKPKTAKSKLAKPKAEKAAKKSVRKKSAKKKSGGFFSFITKYRQDPETWNKPDATPAPAQTQAPVIAANSTRKNKTIATTTSRASTPTAKTTRVTPKPRSVSRPKVNTYSTLPTEDVVKKTQTKAQNPTGPRKKRRQIGALLTPNVDRLPTKKDLQEVQPVIPNSGISNGIKIPIKP